MKRSFWFMIKVFTRYLPAYLPLQLYQRWPIPQRQARDLEVRGSNTGPGANFSLEFK